jgi:lysophospholipase L1-like esterase
MRVFWRRVPLLFSVLPAAVLAWGFREALRGGGGRAVPVSAVERPEPPRSGEFLILALGDSLTRGAGEGPGYAAVVADRLKASRSRLRVENLAVDGLESEGLREELSHPYALSLARSASLILLSIGGNDLSHSLPRGTAATLPEELLRARQRLETNLENVLSLLRTQNASVPILLLGLYNPFSISGEGAAGSGYIAQWNASIEQIALRHRVSVVPVFDLFERRPDRLSPDRFHPNRRGYELIAERVLQEM